MGFRLPGVLLRVAPAVSRTVGSVRDIARKWSSIRSIPKKKTRMNATTFKAVSHLRSVLDAPFMMNGVKQDGCAPAKTDNIFVCLTSCDY